MLICQCCAVTTILANKPRPASMMTPVALDVIDFDLTRLTNVCKFDFGNGANRSISLDFSLVSTQLPKAAVSIFSAVSRSYVMLSVAFTSSVTFLDLKGFTQLSTVCMTLCTSLSSLSCVACYHLCDAYCHFSTDVYYFSSVVSCLDTARNGSSALRLRLVPTIPPFVLE